MKFNLLWNELLSDIVFKELAQGFKMCSSHQELSNIRWERGGQEREQ